jgi:Phosphotransferase enzyme family
MNAVLQAAAPALDLDLYTDTAAMRLLLQAQLPGGPDITGLRVRSARRNTSQQRNPRPLTLCYELQCRQGTQLLYGEVFRHAADAQAAHDQAQTQPLHPPLIGAPLVLLPELHLLLWALPNDPGLPQLATLLDPQRVAAHLPGGDSADGVQVELLRYEPRQRATLRYTLAAPDGGAPRTVYAKTFRDDRAATIDARFSHFWRCASVDPQAPLVAQPLGHDAALRAVWQAPAQGVPLRQLLNGGDAGALLGRVAQALAALQSAPLAPTATATPRSVAHWLAEVRRRRQKISRIDPAMQDRVTRIAAAIEAQAEREALRPLGLIHGDFHPDQVWVQEGRVLLFDFDEFTWGDPMEDVAEFVLKLEQDGTPAALVAAFIEHCAAAAPARFDRRSLAWHLAIQSLLQASRAFVYQQPGWAQTLATRLQACEARVATLQERAAT